MDRRALAAVALAAAVTVAAASGATAGDGRVAFGAPDGLHLADPDGVEPPIVLPVAGDCATCSAVTEPAWAPDGSRVAYVARDGLHVVAATGTDDRIVAPPPLLAHARPAWSPDGSTLAFVDAVGSGVSGDLFTVRADGSALRRLTTSGHVNSAPSWSPDGSRLVTAETVESAPLRSLLIVVAAASGQRRELPDPATGPVWDAAPAWSPDGSEIAFVHGQGTFAALEVVRPDGSDARALTPAVLPLAQAPAWWPDGSRILFTSIVGSRPGRFGPEGSDVYAVDLAGRATRLTEAAERRVSEFAAQPSPAGDKVVFESTCCGGGAPPTPTIRVMNADGTCEHSIGSPGGSLDPAWQAAAQPASAPYRCADLAVLASFAAGRVTATAFNNGTDPLTNVALTVRPRRLSAVFSALVAGGSCARAGAVATCRVARLEPGSATTAIVDVRPLRVGRTLVVTVEGEAAESETETWNNVVPDVDYAFRTCRADGPGGGFIGGTPNRDVICGRRGSDTIAGLAGDDRIDGGHGRDRLLGGAGADVILARDGTRDVVDCGPGRDTAVVDASDSVRACEHVHRRRL